MKGIQEGVEKRSVDVGVEEKVSRKLLRRR
jgi:hypothetical protein